MPVVIGVAVIAGVRGEVRRIGQSWRKEGGGYHEGGEKLPLLHLDSPKISLKRPYLSPF